MAALAKAPMLLRAKRYLAHRRKMGFALAVEGYLLLDFARFADRVAPRQALTTTLVLQWATRPQTKNRVYHALRYAVVRGFARYCAALDPQTEVPAPLFLGSVFKRRAPHIFSPEQIRLILRRAKALSPRVSPLRPFTYATLFALATCAGLRRCELVRLGVDDLDVAAGCLRVPRSKFSPPADSPAPSDDRAGPAALPRDPAAHLPTDESFLCRPEGSAHSARHGRLDAAPAHTGYQAKRGPSDRPLRRSSPRFRHPPHCSVEPAKAARFSSSVAARALSGTPKLPLNLVVRLS
jgi:hypothetical protein